MHVASEVRPSVDSGVRKTHVCGVDRAASQRPTVCYGVKMDVITVLVYTTSSHYTNANTLTLTQ